MATASNTPAGAERGGRPRDPAIDVAVLDETLRVLVESGYARVTLDAVAKRAGTSVPAIRRRWPGRPQLVLAALASTQDPVAAPDTGCTLCDLDECLRMFVATFARMPPGVLGPLFADCAPDPELRTAFMDALFDPPRAAVEETLTRAHARGDLQPDSDREMILDLLASFVYYRVLFGHAAIDDHELERAVETILRGAAQDYDALLEHSRRMEAESPMHHLHD